MRFLAIRFGGVYLHFYNVSKHQGIEEKLSALMRKHIRDLFWTSLRAVKRLLTFVFSK